MTERKKPTAAEPTMPNRAAVERPSVALRTESLDVPWFLARALNGEGDLHAELAQQYPTQALMSLISLRQVTGRQPRNLAICSAPDGAASLTFEVNPLTRGLRCTYTLFSMLSLHFEIASLTDADRSQWLEAMQRGPERVEILWGKQRWRSDFMIWSQQLQYTNVYAFSVMHTEAAARLTPDVMGRLMNWLAAAWSANTPSEPPVAQNVSW